MHVLGLNDRDRINALLGLEASHSCRPLRTRRACHAWPRTSPGRRRVLRSGWPSRRRTRWAAPQPCARPGRAAPTAYGLFAGSMRPCSRSTLRTNSSSAWICVMPSQWESISDRSRIHRRVHHRDARNQRVRAARQLDVAVVQWPAQRVHGRRFAQRRCLSNDLPGLREPVVHFRVHQLEVPGLPPSSISRSYMSPK